MPKHVPEAFLASRTVGFAATTVSTFRASGGVRLQPRVGAVARGANTISQQIAKNLFLSRDRTVIRKLSEAVLTWRLETHISKDRLLDIYLNAIELTLVPRCQGGRSTVP